MPKWKWTFGIRVSDKVLVTGAAGFIGSALCRELLNRGNSVVGIDNYLENSYSSEIKKQNILNVKTSLGGENFHFLELDLRYSDFSILDSDFDYVINQAAMPGLPQSWTNFELYASCNVVALQKLLHWASTKSVKRIIQASTSSVYGKNAECDENGEMVPYSPYGVTKLAAEKLLFAYQDNYSLDVRVLRYFSVYGPGQRPDMAYSRIIDALLTGNEFVKFGDGEQSRSNTYVGDIVNATILSMYSTVEQKVFNVCGDESVTLNKVIGILEEISEKKLRTVSAPERPGDQLNTSGVNQLAKQLLIWQPKFNLELGLFEQFKYMRELNQKK
jgi:UDP-glucuronate 4-epimerase